MPSINMISSNNEIENALWDTKACDELQEHFCKYAHIHATPPVHIDSPVKSALQGMEQMENTR